MDLIKKRVQRTMSSGILRFSEKGEKDPKNTQLLIGCNGNPDEPDPIFYAMHDLKEETAYEVTYSDIKGKHKISEEGMVKQFISGLFLSLAQGEDCDPKELKIVIYTDNEEADKSGLHLYLFKKRDEKNYEPRRYIKWQEVFDSMAG